MLLQRSSSMLYILGRVTRGTERKIQRLAKPIGCWKQRLLFHHTSNAFKRNHEQFVCLSTICCNHQKNTTSLIKTLSYSTNTSAKENEASADSKQKSDEDKVEVKQTGDEDKAGDESQLTVFQRFKIAYKEHGKVLIGVHLATSAVWFGSFFYAARVGVDVIPLMEYLGFSDRIINPFRSSSVGDIALAYLMYKLATPARYTVTLGGTNFMIKYLRKTGKMEPKQENFRELIKDGRDEVKEKSEKLQEKFKERQSERRKQKEDPPVQT